MRSPTARADAVGAVVLGVVFGAALAEAGSFPFRSAVFPRVVTGAGLAFAAILLARELLPRRRPAVAVDDAPDGEAEFFRTAPRSQWLPALAWAAAFFAGLWVLGTTVTIVAFSALYLRVAARARLVVIVPYVVVSYVWVQVLFVDFLHLQLP